MSRWEPLLEQLVLERYPRLVARAMLVAGSRDEAEDLVQDALVATFGSRARFESVAQAESYVRRAVVTRSVDRGRRRTTERSALERLGAHPAADVTPAVPGLEPELEHALSALSPRVRACVVLRHVEDLSVKETARLLRLSEGAVKRYVSDGVAALNATLGTRVSADVEAVNTEEVGRRA